MRYNSIFKSQKILFGFAAVICLLPVWILPYFHTGDGPAHIYSAKVFSELVLNSDSFYKNYFELNSIPVPNSVVQFLFAVLLPFIAFPVANKIVITVIIVVMLTGYNYFIKSLNVKSNISFAIILLIYCFPIKMGLYSMLIGIGVMLYASGYYIKYRSRMIDHDIMILTLLVMLTWFCHLFSFFGLLLLIAVYEITSMVLKQESVFKRRRNLKLLICFIPALLFTALFSNAAFYSTPIKFASDENLLHWITNLKVMNFCGTDKEIYIKWTFCLLGMISLFHFIRSVESRNAASVFLLITVALLLLMAFVFPENYFSGGFINIRLTYFMLIISCVFIDVMIRSGWMNLGKNLLLIAAAIIASINVYINQKTFSDDITILLNAAPHIKEKSVVLPLNYSSTIMEYNFMLYLACEKDIIVLDNAEAATPNSLVKWKDEVWKPQLIGNYLESSQPVVSTEKYEATTSKLINNLLLWKYSKDLILSAQFSSYKEAFRNDNVLLLERKIVKQE